MRRWKGPECNYGIRDRGLKQKLQGSKGIKDIGGRLPLCPRNERTSSWIYRKTIDSLEIAKQNAGSYDASREIKDWTLWRGRPPPKRKTTGPPSILRENITRTFNELTGPYQGVARDERT
jgi:hypothetical protein